MFTFSAGKPGENTIRTEVAHTLGEAEQKRAAFVAAGWNVTDIARGSGPDLFKLKEGAEL
jgi:hypothetical protein